MRQSASVRCTGLTVSYGETLAVDAISFSAFDGEVLGLLGPNGAGKMSAIRALTTIIHPDSGDISMAGFGLDRPDEIRSRVGAVPESSGYPSAQTAIEFVSYHGRLYGLEASAANERAGLLLGAGVEPASPAAARRWSPC